MSEGGTTKIRLEQADAALQEELELWTELNITPHGWRMGHGEFLFRCEQLAVAQILKDKLGMTDDELNLILKEVTLKELKVLRPQVAEQQAAAARARILQGMPNPNPMI